MMPILDLLLLAFVLTAFVVISVARTRGKLPPRGLYRSDPRWLANPHRAEGRIVGTA